MISSKISCLDAVDEGLDESHFIVREQHGVVATEQSVLDTVLTHRHHKLTPAVRIGATLTQE